MTTGLGRFVDEYRTERKTALINKPGAKFGTFGEAIEAFVTKTFKGGTRHAIGGIDRKHRKSKILESPEFISRKSIESI
ncbi:hypothetical protein QUA82_19085 [Microcoleus sp. F8-D3]